MFAADTEVSRGGVKDLYGTSWSRDFTLCLAVSDPDFWSSEPVLQALRSALEFASGDLWQFHFLADTTAAPAPVIPLSLDPAETLGKPDSVMLLSGGLDSLCAVIEQVTARKRRPLLVSHSPDFNLTARQKQLRGELKRRYPRWPFPFVNAAVHRVAADAKENTQRTRSFLYGVLGSIAASQLGITDVHLADNGIVSLNLPISGQVIGSMASRSTHPEFIRRLNELLKLVYQNPPFVSNPLWNRTRPETIELLRVADGLELIEMTRSCAHPRFKTRLQGHCGTCSQCIDRRFGTLAAGVDEYDPAVGYEVDIFRDALAEGDPRTMALSYYTFSAELAMLSDAGMFSRHPELIDCVDRSDDGHPAVAAELVSMLRRHGNCVTEVMEEQITRSKRALARQQLPPACLIALVAAQVSPGRAVAGDFWHSPDYRKVRLGSQPYTLSTNRARVVEFMHKQHQAGDPVMNQAAILARLQIRSKNLYQVFRGCPAWGHVIVKAEPAGFFRLGI